MIQKTHLLEAIKDRVRAAEILLYAGGRLGGRLGVAPGPLLALSLGLASKTVEHGHGRRERSVRKSTERGSINRFTWFPLAMDSWEAKDKKKRKKKKKESDRRAKINAPPDAEERKKVRSR